MYSQAYISRRRKFGGLCEGLALGVIHHNVFYMDLIGMEDGIQIQMLNALNVGRIVGRLCEDGC